MDTIEVKFNFRGNPLLEEIESFKNHVSSLTSPKGYRYCDFLRFSRTKKEKKLGAIFKISYPRYFNGDNSYLITTRKECFEVQEHLINSILCDPFFRAIIVDVKLARVDIPFTYYMREDMDFHSYINAYKIFALVYNIKKEEMRAKGYIDLIDEKYETVVYSDNGKTDKSSNDRLMIYNQYQKLKTKLGEERIEEIIANSQELKRRMRLEVSKRIRREPFSLENFKNFDILGEYFDDYKNYILENVLNREIIENLYNEKVKNLSELLSQNRALGNFNYEVFILKNLDNIYDYEILRRALGIEIDNSKTRESAITRVRKILNEYEKEERIIIMDTYKIICEMGCYITGLKIKE